MFPVSPGSRPAGALTSAPRRQGLGLPAVFSAFVLLAGGAAAGLLLLVAERLWAALRPRLRPTVAQSSERQAVGRVVEPVQELLLGTALLWVSH